MYEYQYSHLCAKAYCKLPNCKSICCEPHCDYNQIRFYPLGYLITSHKSFMSLLNQMVPFEYGSTINNITF